MIQVVTESSVRLVEIYDDTAFIGTGYGPMAAAELTNRDRVAEFVAGRLADRADVVGMWVQEVGGEMKVWIHINSATVEQERSVRRLLWELMDRYTDLKVDLQVSNVRLVPEEQRENLIPAEAQRVVV